MYRYAEAGYPDVQFDCELIQSGSDILGKITEVDIYKPSGLYLLNASVIGQIDGRELTFTKTYINASDIYAAPVFYVGKANMTGKRISGNWSISKWQGTFMMIRDNGKLLKADTRLHANDRNIKERV